MAMETVTRDKTIELTLASIEKQFGKGAIMRLGDADRLVKELEVISTGSLALDIALGTGGLARGRIIEVFGPESSGKTTLALQVIGQAQQLGGVCAFIDAEHALDVGYAKKLGVKIEDLLVSQPDCGEQALEIAEMLVRSGAVSVIVVDSVAALVPRAEIEGEMGDSHMGLQARLMSQAMRKLTPIISQTSTAVIFINQLREKVGVVFGNPEVTPGGRALKFYSSVRIELRRVDSVKKGTDVIGNRVKAKIVKNKVAPPFKQAEFEIMFEPPRGISRTGDIIDLGVEYGIVNKAGAFYSYGDLRIGQGRENAKQFLADNTELCQEIESDVRREAHVPGVKPKDEPKAAAQPEAVAAKR